MNEGDHLMKSLDDLIAEDKGGGRGRGGFNKFGNNNQSKSNFHKKGIQKNKGFN